MNKSIAAVVTFLVCASFALAKPVSERAAIGNAKVFLKQNLVSRQEMKLSIAYKGRKAIDGNPRIYVCNMGADQGFVILSGDDRTVPVLAYSDTGSFDADNMPDNVQWWMDYYEEAVAQVADMQLSNNASAARPTDVISPLITTKWDQSEPYNQMCPKVNGATPPTGCVATAMAQLMYYHKWPIDSTEAIDAYTTESYKVNVEKLKPTTFQWNDMLRSYGRNATQKQKDAVAKLMRYCGQLVQMDYTPSSSGAQTFYLGWVLPRAFKYPNTIHNVFRDGYSIEQWDSLLINELKNKRPILYTGYTMAFEGHAFLCDGYDGKGYYHINWGWSGAADGHYRISVLDANANGIGGSSTSMRFSLMQSAIIGVKTSGEDEYRVPEKVVAANSRPSLKAGRTYFRTGNDTDFKGVTVNFTLTNLGEREENFNVGLALCDSEGTIIKTLKTTSRMLWLGYADEVEMTVNLGKGLEDGDYAIMPVFRKGSVGSVKTAYNAEKNHIDISIKGDTMLATPVPKADFKVNSVEKVGKNIVVNLTNNDEEFNGYLAARKFNDKGEVEDVAYEPAAVLPNTNRNISLYIDENHSLDLNKDIYFLSVDAYPDQYFYTNAFNSGAILKGQLNILNLSDDSTTVVGDKVMCRVRLNNMGDGVYHHFIDISLVNEQGDEVKYNKIIHIEKGDSLDILAELTPKVFDKKYKVVLRTYKEMTLTAMCETDMHNVVKGAVYWTAQGKMLTMPAAQVFDVPEDAVAVNLRKAYTNNVTPNDNPNTIYMLENAVPKGLSGKNVFNAENKGGYANLYDGADCFIPQNLFVTVAAKFSRTFHNDELGTWSTINLPFEPQKITVDGEPVDWFHHDGDTGKDFYLQKVKEVKNATVHLEYTDQFLPFTTYFISIGPSLVGKTVVFESGKEIILNTDFASKMNETFGDYTFQTPSVWTTARQLSDTCTVYELNGENYSITTDGTLLRPFRAYIIAGSSASNTSAITINGPMLPDGIYQTEVGESLSGYTVHNIAGQLIGSFHTMPHLPSGIYIVNGKKTVVP